MNKKQKEALTYSRETMNFIEQMIGGASHEINNLLFIIEGNSELLEMSDDKRKKSEIICNIETQTHRIAEVLKDLRSLIKEQDEPSEQVSTRWISDQIGEFCKTRFSNHKVFLKTSLPEHIFIDAKKTQIIQAFLSLLNASHEAVVNTKGFAKWIDLKIEESNGELKIQVSDSGSLISDKDSELFSPDYNKGGRKGLPLVIAKDSIEKNGATLKHVKGATHNTFEISFKKYHKANAVEMEEEIPVNIKLVG